MAQLPQELNRVRTEIRCMTNTRVISALSSCLRLAQIPTPFRPSGPLAVPGISLAMELSRLIQNTSRTASGPLTSAEIAAADMQAKGMPPNDAAFKEIVAAREIVILRSLVKRGTVAKSGTSRTLNGR